MPTEPLEPSAKRRRFSLVRNVALAGALVAAGWWAGGRSSAPAQTADSAATTQQADIPAPPAVPDTNAEVAALRKKATGGDASAQYELGIAYASGKGLPEDSIEAERWLRLGSAPMLASMRSSATTADREDGRTVSRSTSAQQNLGLLYLDGYYDGIHVTIDTAEALRWLRLAAANWPANWEGSESGDTVEPQEILRRLTESPADRRRRENPYAERPTPTATAPGTTGRGPVPTYWKVRCAAESDEDYMGFAAVGGDEWEHEQAWARWKQSGVSQRKMMDYIRCLNVNWNFKQ
jgi:hypothetical protein